MASQNKSPCTSTPRKRSRSESSTESLPSFRRQKVSESPSLPILINDSRSTSPDLEARTKSMSNQRAPLSMEDLDDLNISPVDYENDCTTRPPRTPELKSKSKPKSASTPSLNPVAPIATWIFFTVQIIGMSYQKGKAKELATKLSSHVGGTELIRIDEIMSKSLNIRVKPHMVMKAKSFKHGSVELNFKELESYKLKKKENARGIINVPSDQNFAKFEKDLKTKNAEIESIKQNFMYRNNEKVPTQTASVVFKGNQAPVKLQGLTDLVKPVFLAIIRCQKCQMFGHRNVNGSCRKSTKCPHCAGDHEHNQCKNRQNKKCANCHGPHSAAYRGCTHFLAYQRKINGNNAAIETSFLSKCTNENVAAPTIAKPQSHRPPKPVQTTKPAMTNRDIVMLATKLENKPASDIIVILRQELRPTTAPAHNANGTTQATDSQNSEKAADPSAPTTSKKPACPNMPYNRPVPHYKANGWAPYGPYRHNLPHPHRPIWAHNNRGPHGPPPRPLMRMQCKPSRHFGFPPCGGPIHPRHHY